MIHAYSLSPLPIKIKHRDAAAFSKAYVRILEYLFQSLLQNIIKHNNALQLLFFIGLAFQILINCIPPDSQFCFSLAAKCSLSGTLPNSASIRGSLSIPLIPFFIIVHTHLAYNH